MHAVDPQIPTEVIVAGKLRRYQKLALWRQLLQIRTIVLPNIIDSFKLVIGLCQSIYKLLRWRPDVIFAKGGFVCLPVGIAARILGVPLVIHDSDAHPGLTNRVLARFAARIATGAPLEYYNYPSERSTYIGIPIAMNLRPPSSKEQLKLKKELGFDDEKPLIVITGGGLGARTLNQATIAVLTELLAFCNVSLITGKANYDQLRQQVKPHDRRHFQMHAFVSKDFTSLLSAADIVVTRAGATTLLELAALAKPVIIVPNEYLTGGHQSKNAAVYEKAGAAVIVGEERLSAQPLALVDAINALVLNPKELQAMAEAIHEFARPQAARDMADIILSVGKSS
ncbi:N-acetylglucosaminyl transferase [Candidatus Saccharibacteria bacterium RAAC3_TM7_1]|nr:N-acetylglucosaminyl transferase [Candidatus Saccharibacteria bacterium RAAC3_TM7_1]